MKPTKMALVAKSEDVPNYGTGNKAREDDVISEALKILKKRLNNKGPTLAGSSDVRNYLQLQHSARQAEVFGVIFLDSRHRVIANEEMFNGTATGVAVYPREVAKRALALNATAVIVYHNHPSGTPEPSRADELLTTQLKDALALVEVRVVDHIVASSEGTTSFSERGLL